LRIFPNVEDISTSEEPRHSSRRANGVVLAPTENHLFFVRPFRQQGVFFFFVASERNRNRVTFPQKKTFGGKAASLFTLSWTP